MRRRSLTPTLVGLGLFAAYALVTVVFFWPWLPHLSDSLIGPPGDNMNDLWGTYYVTVAADPRHFFYTDLIRFPEGTPLYYHSFSYPKNLAIAFASKLVGSDRPTLVLLHNLTLLVSFPLAGIGAFYLVRHLTGSITGALMGGFIFAFNPAHVAHTSQHIGVASIEFYPFFVLAYLLALERRSLRGVVVPVPHLLSGVFHRVSYGLRRRSPSDVADWLAPCRTDRLSGRGGGGHVTGYRADGRGRVHQSIRVRSRSRA